MSESKTSQQTGQPYSRVTARGHKSTDLISQKNELRRNNHQALIKSVI